jgi:hypothetical protein
MFINLRSFIIASIASRNHALSSRIGAKRVVPSFPFSLGGLPRISSPSLGILSDVYTLCNLSELFVTLRSLEVVEQVFFDVGTLSI